MQMTTIINRRDYLNGGNLLAQYQVTNLKKTRLKVAACEFVNVVLFSGIWLYSFGFSRLRDFAAAMASLSVPGAETLACFIFFTLSLYFLKRTLSRLLLEASTAQRAKYVVRDMNGWLKHILSAKAGFTANMIVLTDSGKSVSLELFGVGPNGKPLLLSMASPRYMTKYDRNSHTQAEFILARLQSAAIGVPSDMARSLISSPDSGAEVDPSK